MDQMKPLILYNVEKEHIDDASHWREAAWGGRGGGMRIVFF